MDKNGEHHQSQHRIEKDIRSMCELRDTLQNRHLAMTAIILGMFVIGGGGDAWSGDLEIKASQRRRVNSDGLIE